MGGGSLAAEEGAVRVLIVDKLAPHVAPELESLGVAVTVEIGLKG
jgi:hypothetical protein